MAAVVRVKRHLDDEPLSALILNCKKRKTCETESESEITTVLTFAGTLKTQEEDISSHISKLTKDSLEQSYKKHTSDITSKIKQQTKDASDTSRFKIVNFFRSIDKEMTSNGGDTVENMPFTVLDVENAQSDANAAVADNLGYVYDIYYTSSDEIQEPALDSVYQVCPVNEVIFDTGETVDSDHDSEDSNDENDWRNDYPDEEDEESVDEDDMRKAMDNLSINGNLSSDDEQDGFMYSIDSEAVGFEEDCDQSDSRRYGELYARFKIRQKKEEERYNKDVCHDEIDDTDEDFLD